MNEVILMGRLTRDPEARTSNELSISHYSLAVNRGWSSKDETAVDFFDCVAFGKSADFANKHLRKGTKVLIQGRLQNRSWEKDGVTHKVTEIVVNNQEFAESKQAAAEPAPTPSPDDWIIIPADIDEELSFA